MNVDMFKLGRHAEIMPGRDGKRVMVLFGASSFQADWVLERWNTWRRIKQDTETQLAAGGN